MADKLNVSRQTISKWELGESTPDMEKLRGLSDYLFCSDWSAKVTDKLNNVNVNFRMDEDLKKSMEQACSDMGLSMTTAFTIFAKKVSREKRIPFEVSADPFYSEENMARLRQSVAQMEATGGTIHEVELDD